MLYDDFKRVYQKQTAKQARLLKESQEVENKEKFLKEYGTKHQSGLGFGDDETQVVGIRSVAPFSMLEKNPNQWAEKVKEVILDRAGSLVNSIEFYVDKDEDEDFLRVELKNGTILDLMFNGGSLWVRKDENDKEILVGTDRPERHSPYSTVMNAFMSLILNKGEQGIDIDEDDDSDLEESRSFNDDDDDYDEIKRRYDFHNKARKIRDAKFEQHYGVSAIDMTDEWMVDHGWPKNYTSLFAKIIKDGEDHNDLERVKKGFDNLIKKYSTGKKINESRAFKLGFRSGLRASRK